MITIKVFAKVINSGQELIKNYNDQILISQIINDLNLSQDLPCGGKGICGKCKIRVTGDVSAPTNIELKKLTPKELDENIRLSCQTYALGNVTIYYTSSDSELQAVDFGFMPDFRKDPITGSEKCKAVAIDVGTTTIAAYLYDFPEGICVGSLCEKNLQTAYGADVISRMEYELNGGLKELQQTIVNQIDSIILKLTDEKPDTIVVTGNTIMLHFFNGLSTEGIAKYPFTPKSLFGCWKGRYYFPRCISSYVGADITTAIIASDMLKDKTSFLVDIGTNGEMAVWHDGILRCCSTAAGPVLEGAKIKNGMLASSGAICKVYLENNNIRYKTIGNTEPVGICGTGLIDAVSCMKDLEVFDETGYMENDYMIGNSNIYITPEDIRSVQLAKAAISAGIDTLLHECKISYDEIEKFYIAGSFGSFINKYSAANIGLIPREVLDKVVVLGNAAGIGAGVLLQSKEMLEKSEEIAKSAITVELSQSPFFMQKYVDNMIF